MARSFILGGVSATGLATGKPFIQRIVREGGNGAAINGDGPYDRTAGEGTLSASGDNFTVSIDNGDLLCGSQTAPDWNASSTGDETQTADGLGGELLFVEFPTTTRTLTVQLEEANPSGGGEIRLKVMLAAEGQVVRDLDSVGAVTTSTDTMNPLTNGNFIEISNGEAATINARTKGVFILIQKYAAAGYDALGVAGAPLDHAVILVTGILDHEGFQGSNGVQTTISAGSTNMGTSDAIKKIWPLSSGGSEGIG